MQEVLDRGSHPILGCVVGMSYKDLTGPELQRILEHAKSLKRFKEMLGIGETELRPLLAQHHLSIKRLSTLSPNFVSAELKRIGSVSLFCIIYGCKPIELHDILSSCGVSLKQLITTVGATSGTGRKGEDYFKHIRGSMIAMDCFEEEGHTHPFDFRDRYYGLVNVKTANRQRYKATTRSKDPNFWHFSTKGWKSCDYLALVPLDPKGNPQMILMVSTAEIGTKYPTHLVLTGKHLKWPYVSPQQNDRNRLDSEREYLLLTTRLNATEPEEVFSV